jgi:cell wall-associated NlpC family hydrolase
VKSRYYTVFIGMMLTTIVGCSSSDPADITKADQPTSDLDSVMAKNKVTSNVNDIDFNNVYDVWKGTPYRLGGNTKRGIDCSAFVQVGYSSVYEKMLPRTTSEQVKLGRYVAVANAKEGDLVFFKTGYTTRHVGIYLGNSEFLHASTSRGVMISRLDNPYWSRKFWQIRRIN